MKDEQAINQTKKNKKILFGSIAGALFIIVITVILLIIFTRNSNKTIDTYEAANEIYSSNNISYTVEEYENDKAIFNEINNSIQNEDNSNYDTMYSALSDSYKAQDNKNNKIINHILNDIYGNDTNDNSQNAETLKVDTSNLIKQLLTQIKESSDHIDNYYGLDAVDFKAGMDQEVQDAREIAYKDLRNIEKYAQTGVAPQLEYWQTTPNVLLVGEQYSSYYKCQFSMSQSEMASNNNFLNYTYWFKYGHPRITTINAIDLEEGFWQFGDTYYNLKAKIVTDVGTYSVYTSLVAENNNNYTYWFYDLEQLS